MLKDQVPYYIIDLLQQSPAVDIRGLGRFEAIFHPATVDSNAGQIKPPFLRPEFNEQPVEDHRLLTKYIAYVTGAPDTFIDQAIEDFVRNVKDETDTHQQYAIEQFGTFSKADGGNLRFTPDWDAFNLSFRGLEVLDLQEKKAVHLEPVPPITVEPVHPAVFPIAEHEIIPEPESKINLIPEIKPVDHKPGIDESTSRLWWIILISALVLITVLCGYLAWDILSNRHRLDTLANNYPEYPVIPQDDSSKIIDSTHYEVNPLPTDTQSTPIEQTPVEPKPVPPAKQEQPTTNGEYCYVVVGAFADPNNIVRMEERLTSMGYTSEQLKGRTITRVAIRTSCDKETLNKVLGEARASINPEAWIY